MKNVSNDFKNIIKSGGPFFSYATAVLADGTSLTFDSYDDFSNDGNSYAESGGSGFPLGVALAKQIAINLENTDGRFSEYDFYGTVFTAYTEADLPAGTTERIPEGRFTVIDSVAPGDVLEITAYDNMYKLDSSFTSGLTYPATLQQMWNELCSYYDLTNGSPSFANNDFTVLSAPTGLTGRELAGYIAQLAIGNAIVDANGRLCIKSYDFAPFDTPETVSADDIETESGIPILSDFTSDPDIGTDDVSITGVMTTVDNEESNEDTTLVYGTDVYALSISNPLIAGKESTAIAMIGDALIGVTVRPFSGSFSPNPAVEVMDLVYVVDKKDNAYKSFITENDFEYLGNSSVTNGLESPERNRSTYSGNATEVYRRLQQQINNQKNSFEKAVDNLEDQLQNASGLYSTEKEQPDGSVIYYFHDKLTLAESETIIKITSQALGISTNGGESYPVGITVDGEAIVSILQTVGINADWINTGAIRIKDDDGNDIFYADMDTKQVIIAGDSVRIGDKNLPEAIEEARSLSVILDNEYQGIPADYEGNITTFPTVQTKVQVYLGSDDVSSDCIYSISESTSVAGSWNSSAKLYTVTDLLEDTGWVDITATYLGLFSATKRFNVQKVKGGEPGADGDSVKIYTLEYSTNIIKKGGNNILTPDNVVFCAYVREGDSTTRNEYFGRWKIEETTDGNKWNTVYESSENESSVTHFLYAILSDAEGNGISTANGEAIAIVRDDVVAIRANLYAADGLTDLIDSQTVSVVIDADSLTHEDIFNLLTNNGEIQGIYQEGNQIYINGTYIKIDDLVSLNAEIGGWDINNEGIYKKFEINDDNYMVFLRKPSTISYSREDIIGIYHISEEGDIISKIFNIDSLGGYSNYHFGESGLSDSSIVIDGGDVTFYDESGKVIGYIKVYSDYLQIGGADDGGFLRFTVEKEGSSNLSYIRTESSINTSGNMRCTSLSSDIVSCLSLSVSQYKNRIVSTKNYGKVRQYCYEMASPFFGDIGQGHINEKGECCIFLDDIFSETLNNCCEYQVFLQKEGEGDLWVSKKEQNYFIVTGTPNLRFAWEIKAVQINNETERLESFDIFEENIHMDENEMESAINEEIDKFFSF